MDTAAAALYRPMMRRWAGRLTNLRWTRRVAFVVAALSLAIACAAKVLPADGQLVVAINTDLAPPKDFDLLHVEAKRQGAGASFYSNEFVFFGTRAAKVPATINFVGGSDRTPIEIRIEARKGEKVRVVRDIRVVIPSERVAQLNVALSYLCDAKTCDAGKTCIFGACEDVNVEESTLPSYDAASVFGGAPEGSGGACFDTLECFSRGAPAPVDTANDGCTIAKPAGNGAVNVAVLLPAGTDGVCAANACLVVLDSHPSGQLGPLLGWRDDGGRIALPREICSRGLPVVTTAACEPKTPRTPTCGTWSSVGVGKQTDAGPLPFSPDGSTFCAEGMRDCVNGRTPRLCVQGAFVEHAPCPEACNAGVCAECTEGTKSCGSSPVDGGAPIPRSCVGGAWQPLAPCGSNLLCGAGVCADREWTAWPMPGHGLLPDGATPRIPDSNYIIEPSIVTDKTTGLQWHRDSVLADDLVAGTAHCATSTIRGGGWRVPTAVELFSLVDYGAEKDPLINTTAFPDLPTSSQFRSSTPVGGANTYHQDVLFWTGTLTIYPVTTPARYRCVR